MARFSFSAPSTLTATDALAFLADMRNAQSWDPSISSVTRLDDGEIRLGSAFRVILSFSGRNLDLTYHVTEWRDQESVTLRAESPLFISEDIVRISDEGGLVTVNYEATLTGRGWALALDPFFHLSINHFGKQAAPHLRAALQP